MQRVSAKRRHFDRNLLETARSFYERELGELGRPSRGWAQARCPFHHPDKHASFGVHLASGGFFCFSCGARGGNILDFVMQRDGVGFRTAAIRLGAWVQDDLADGAENRALAERERRQRIHDAAIKLAEAEKSLRVEYGKVLRSMEGIISEMRERLRSHQVASDEYEACGQLLSLALDDLRWSIAAYTLLCSGAISQRANFVLHFDQREAVIMKVMMDGNVTDDEGHVTEVVLP